MPKVAPIPAPDPGGWGPVPPESRVGPILICDPDYGRRSLVVRVVSACGATAIIYRLSAGSDTLPSDSRVAVIAMGDTSDEPMAVECIRALTRHGLHVITYQDGAHAWPLPRRCQALLAGATIVLDSASSEFAGDLKEQLNRLLREVQERSLSDDQIQATMQQFRIVGRSSPMVSAFRTVMRISTASDLPVLITGETGTGKELFARAIHRLDRKRREGPMVSLNCGAISTELAESELFGHRRGAFTGATESRKGLFRAADGGVLFLDEIGEMAFGLQSKILRVIETGAVLSVGEDEETSVSVRVIAATNRELADLSASPSFRADLLHRLNVLALRLPALSERIEDLQPLVFHFLQKHADLSPSPHWRGGASQDFFDALRLTPLPGNVRQLENLVRWAIVNKSGDSDLCLSDLPPAIWRQLTEQRAKAQAPGPPAELDAPVPSEGFFTRLLEVHGGNLSACLEHCEQHLVEAALQQAQGNQSRAAQRLGITPRSVYNKLRKRRISNG